jgi:hypothetical protein
MMGNFTLGGVGAEPSAANIINDEIQGEQHRFFIQQIMSSEDQRTQVMNSSALRFHMSGNDGDDTPEGLETQKMYHHIPPYVSDLESSQLEPINVTDQSQNEDNPMRIATGVDQLYYQNAFSQNNDHQPLPANQLLTRNPFFTPRDSHPDLPAHSPQH